MFGVIAGIIAAAGILLFIGVEMPNKLKQIFHRMPSWISSTIISVSIGYLIGGVTGGVAGFVAEVILFPTFSYLRRKRIQEEQK